MFSPNRVSLLQVEVLSSLTITRDNALLKPSVNDAKGTAKWNFKKPFPYTSER